MKKVFAALPTPAFFVVLAGCSCTDSDGGLRMPFLCSFKPLFLQNVERFNFLPSLVPHIAL